MIRKLIRKVTKIACKGEQRLRVGVITNLILADDFVRNKMSSASAHEWMVALGGNTGNIAFVEGILKSLGNNYDIIGWGDDPRAVNQHYDQIVICCANQIGTHFELITWAKALEAYNLPVTLIGLGVQSSGFMEIPTLSKGSKYFFDVVDHLKPTLNYPNIITRGAYTSEILNRLGVESRPFGCPSLFISANKTLGKKCYQHQNEVSCRMMVAGGNPWGGEFEFERALTELVELYGGNYVIQHPQIMLKIASDEYESLSSEELDILRRAYSHLGDDEAISRWFRGNSVFFADVQNWMHYSKRFSNVIGPRYHGVAIPIQAGVPGKVISIDSRTQELPITTGIPHIPFSLVKEASVVDLAEISRWSKKDAEIFDRARFTNAKNYLSFFNENRLLPSLQLTELSGG